MRAITESEIILYVKSKFSGVVHVVPKIKRKGSKTFYDCYVYCKYPNMIESHRESIFNETGWNIFPRFRLPEAEAARTIRKTIPEIAGLLSERYWSFGNNGVIVIPCRNVGYAIKGKEEAEKNTGWRILFTEEKENEYNVKRLVSQVISNVCKVEFEKRLSKNKKHYNYYVIIFCSNPDSAKTYSDLILKETGWYPKFYKRLSKADAVKIIQSLFTEAGIRRVDVDEDEGFVEISCHNPNALTKENKKKIKDLTGYYVKSVKKVVLDEGTSKLTIKKILGDEVTHVEFKKESDNGKIKYNVYIFCQNPDKSKRYYKDIISKTGWKPVFLRRISINSLLKTLQKIIPEKAGPRWELLTRNDLDETDGEVRVFCTNPHIAVNSISKSEFFNKTGWRVKIEKYLSDPRTAKKIIIERLPRAGIRRTSFDGDKLLVYCFNPQAINREFITWFEKETGYRVFAKKMSLNHREFERFIRYIVPDINYIQIQNESSAIIYCDNPKLYEEYKERILLNTGWRVKFIRRLRKDVASAIISKSFPYEAGVRPVYEWFWDIEKGEVHVPCRNIGIALSIDVGKLNRSIGWRIKLIELKLSKDKVSKVVKDFILPSAIFKEISSVDEGKHLIQVRCIYPERVSESTKMEFKKETGWSLDVRKFRLSIEKTKDFVQKLLGDQAYFIFNQKESWFFCNKPHHTLRRYENEIVEVTGWRLIPEERILRPHEVINKLNKILNIDVIYEYTKFNEENNTIILFTPQKNILTQRDVYNLINAIGIETGWYPQLRFLLRKEEVESKISELKEHAKIVDIKFGEENLTVKVFCINPSKINEMAEDLYEHTGWRFDAFKYSDALGEIQKIMERNQPHKISLKGVKCWFCNGTGTARIFIRELGLDYCPACNGKGRIS